MKKKQFFTGKNLLVYILVAYAFFYLYKYRQNDPPPLFSQIDDIEFHTLNKKKFKLSEIKLRKIIIFLSKKNIYGTFYKKNICEIREISKKNDAFLIVLTPTKQNKNDVLEYINKKAYKCIEKDLYLTNINKVEKLFGINSWPFIVILDEKNRLIYAAKIPSIKQIKEKLRS